MNFSTQQELLESLSLYLLNQCYEFAPNKEDKIPDLADPSNPSALSSAKCVEMKSPSIQIEIYSSKESILVCIKLEKMDELHSMYCTKLLSQLKSEVFFVLRNPSKYIKESDLCLIITPLILKQIEITDIIEFIKNVFTEVGAGFSVVRGNALSFIYNKASSQLS